MFSHGEEGKWREEEIDMKRQLLWVLMVIAGVTLLTGYSPINNLSAEAAVTLEVLNPRGEIKTLPTLAPSPRVTDLAAKKIGIYWNEKAGGNNFWDVIEELLKQAFPTAKIVRYRGPFDPGETKAATIAKECDTFIYGVGD
jgi:hypothetical protein